MTSVLLSGGSFFLTGELVQARAPLRQFRLINDHDGESIFNRKSQAAAPTDQAGFFEREPGVAGIEGAAKNLQQVFADEGARSSAADK